VFPTGVGMNRMYSTSTPIAAMCSPRAWG